jgi:NAD(P)H-nitrite reductase large subunit
MIVIIGNGISGVTAARHIRKKSNEAITIISSESKYFFSRTALMYVFMGHMRFEHTQPYESHFWEKNSITLSEEYITEIDTEENRLLTKSGNEITYSKLIIASGSKPNKFGWKGQNASRVSGLYSKQDLDYIDEIAANCKTAVIVGGGLIGIELAEMLLSRNIEVHFLVLQELYWSNVLPEQDSRLIMDHLKKHHGLHMYYATELAEIVTNDKNEAIAVKTNTGDRINCQFVGLTPGVSPNIEFVRSSKIETNLGILVNRHLETSEKNVYAIGDCAEFRNPLEGRKKIEQVWYTGKIMGETIAETITGERTEYNPGHWFNSAKFFEIEYQTYGMVQNKLLEEQDEFVFQHQTEELLLHFVFEKNSRKFIGINSFGIRLRHPVLNQWLLNEASIDEVLTNLKSANFDPEFCKKNEEDIIRLFNQQFGTNISVSRNRWWQELIHA